MTNKIKDLVKVAAPVGKISYQLSADLLWTYDGSAWKKYYWHSGKNGWVRDIDTTKTITEDTLVSGDAIFFQRATGQAATTFILSGAVRPFTAGTHYEIAAGRFAFVGYPWPVEFNAATVNKYCVQDSVGKISYQLSADQLWVYDTAWIKYYWHSGKKAWVLSTDTTTKAPVESIPVAPGFGFFYGRATGAATQEINFTWPQK